MSLTLRIGRQNTLFETGDFMIWLRLQSSYFGTINILEISSSGDIEVDSLFNFGQIHNFLLLKMEKLCSAQSLSSSKGYSFAWVKKSEKITLKL